MQATQIINIFDEICVQKPELPALWALDLLSSTLRDSSNPSAVSVLLFSRGFHTLVAYRFSHHLWITGRTELARYFQSIISKTLGADIHPAARIGVGCFLSSGTSVVIGETAVVGDNVCISHGVTLGGTGKESGNRHPKVGNGVLLASGCIVMGNIKVGEGSIINAGSVVTKEVEPFTQVAGVPAKFLSYLKRFDSSQRLEVMNAELLLDGSWEASLDWEDYGVSNMADFDSMRPVLPTIYIDYYDAQGGIINYSI